MVFFITRFERIFMSQMRRTPIIAGLALAFLLFPASVSAQKSGFLFRGNMGAGYISLSADDVNDTKITGGGGMAALAFGAFVKPNVALYGEFFFSSITGPTLESGGSTIDTTDDLTATVGGLGAGATIYTQSGVYFGGTVGFSTMSMKYDVGSTSFETTTDPGIGLSFLIGKEWAVGDKWALGVSGQAITGVIPDEDDSWTPMAIGIDFTFTYVAGGYE